MRTKMMSLVAVAWFLHLRQSVPDPGSTIEHDECVAASVIGCPSERPRFYRLSSCARYNGSRRQNITYIQVCTKRSSRVFVTFKEHSRTVTSQHFSL